MPVYRHRVFGPGSAGDTWTTGLHTQTLTGITDVHDAWFTFCQGWFGGSYGDFIGDTTSVAGVVTDLLDFEGHHAISQRSSSLVVAGRGTGGGTSPRACLVVGLKTDTPQRSGRGRMFWPGLDASHYEDNGLFTSADIDTLADELLTLFSSLQIDANPVIKHPFVSAVEASTTPITSLKMGNIPGTQRRRTNKVTNVYESRSF